MSFPPEGTVPYLAAVQLADCAIQLRAEHQRAEEEWQAEKAGLQTTIDQLQKELDRLRTEVAVCGGPRHIPLAAHRVFAIPELLEQILLQLTPSSEEDLPLEAKSYMPLIPERPVVQLFELQLVSRRFAALIAASSALQRHMGLLEVSGPDDPAIVSIAPNEHSDTIVYRASSCGNIVRSAVTGPWFELDEQLCLYKTWPGDSIISGSWTQIKVNLQADQPPMRLVDWIQPPSEIGSATSAPRRRIESHTKCAEVAMWQTDRSSLRLVKWRRDLSESGVIVVHWPVYETQRSTTWGEVAEQMIRARKDIFERHVGWQEVADISPGIFE